MNWVFVRSLAWAVLCFVTVGCSTLSRQSLPQLGLPLPVVQLTGPPTAIGSLAEQGQNSTVLVQGEVRQRAPLTTGWLYRVEDDSGTIWVLTTETAPPLETAVRLEGRLQYRQILVEGQDQGEYYLEEQRRTIIEPETTATDS
jgi:hypothetical protein